MQDLAARGDGGSARPKVVGTEEMAALAEAYRRAGRTVVFTNGCFDLLHVGHVRYLQEAARLGDVLVVGLNSDASVRALKGPGRPVFPESDRAALLAALEAVDHVVLFAEDTPLRLLGLVRPDILVKGGTYKVEEVVGRDFVESYGGRVCVTGQTEGVSTTKILASIAQQRPTCELDAPVGE
jgi:D-beta-D-heptose 7-phosphate kinase/D-beta-D-heptose 1-phosphate adenosyltransferase